jgi:hypothetical protein
LHGQYLAFIHAYTKIHGVAPAEADMQRYFRVTPPSVYGQEGVLVQAIKAEEATGLLATRYAPERYQEVRLE